MNTDESPQGSFLIFSSLGIGVGSVDAGNFARREYGGVEMWRDEKAKVSAVRRGADERHDAEWGWYNWVRKVLGDAEVPYDPTSLDTKLMKQFFNSWVIASTLTARDMLIEAPPCDDEMDRRYEYTSRLILNIADRETFNPNNAQT